MKYIKTYEKLVTLELEDNDLKTMLSQALYTHDKIYKDKMPLIKSIIKSGFNPNYYDAHSYLYSIAIMNISSVPESDVIELMTLFIDYGANLNDAGLNRDLLTTIIEDAIDHTLTLKDANEKLKVRKERIRLLIKSGSDLTNKNYSFLKELETLKKRRVIGKTIEDILNIVKEEKPEEYKIYLAYKNAEKYNI